VAKRRGNGEGSIYRRNDGRWVGQYLVHTTSGPKYRYLYGKTRQVVAEKLTKAMAQRDSALAFETGKLTVAEYMNRWLTDSARNRLRPKTYEDYSGLTLRHIVGSGSHQAEEPYTTPCAAVLWRQARIWSVEAHG
jgi:integrase